MSATIPFIVGKPVTGEYFIDREEELQKMINLLSAVTSKSNSNIALIGLRRTGKTSLFENVKLILSSKEKIVPLIVNCYGISTKARFSRMYMQAVTQAYTAKTKDNLRKDRLTKLMKKGANELSKYISDIDVTIADFAKFHIKLKEHTTSDEELIEMSLRYPQTLAEQKNINFVVMIDEFQDTLKWGEEFLKNFRRIIESQNNIAYAISGSITTIMKDLLYQKRSPLYRQLIEIELKRLPIQAAKEFIKNRLLKANMEISDQAADTLIDYSGSYPDYIQRIGLQLYQNANTQNNNKLNQQDIQTAYNQVKQHLDAEFSTYFKCFTDFEKEVLIALSHGITTPSQIAQQTRKPISSLPQILHRLINHGITEKYIEAHYRISDPIFSDWLSQRYPNMIKA